MWSYNIQACLATAQPSLHFVLLPAKPSFETKRAEKYYSPGNFDKNTSHLEESTKLGTVAHHAVPIDFGYPKWTEPFPAITVPTFMLSSKFEVFPRKSAEIPWTIIADTQHLY